MKRDNPFTLTFGKQPGEYISRYESTDRIVSTFEAEQPVSQAYLIEGIRGGGKTVLMTAVTKELASRGNWVVADLNATQDLLDDLAARLTDACKRMPELLKRGFNISLAGFGIGVDGSITSPDSTGVIEGILSSLKKRGKRLVITIDEVMPGQNMRHFASEFQILLRKEYPVFLIMTGLYENIYAVQNDPALTFLLRTPKIRLEPLSIQQITRQYKGIFDIEMEKAKELAALTKGYAFAFQALGMLCFEYRDTVSMEEILHKLDDMLDDFVYAKIWESLSAQDRNVVRAVSDQKRRVKDVCEELSMTSGTFSKYRERLMKRGLLISPQHGYVALALPRFGAVAESYE